MDTVKLDYLRKLQQRLNNAKHGTKTAIIDNAAAFLDCSKQQVYRELDAIKPVNDTSKKIRKTRSDAGKCIITEDQAKLIGGMILVATRANGKQVLSVKDATEWLIAQGKLPKVSPATVLRALREYHCHPDQLKTASAHTNQRSLHPNHVWQIDASVCVLFYLPKGGLQVMEQKEFYKNKPANVKKVEKERVIRYVITDHYSGTVYCEYVLGAETSENITQVFLNAIQKRAANDPMHGVPHILVLDKGSANMAGYFKNLLERLHVIAIPHATGNSRAKGQVEQGNNLVETKFESRLSFMQVKGLDHLNETLTHWRSYFNSKATHTRTKKTRNASWLSISNEQLRIAPSIELCRELVTTMPKPIKVRGDYTVTHTVKGYPNQAYKVQHLPDIYVKAEVEIVVNPYRAPDIDVLWQGETYTISPVQTNEAGFEIDAPIVGEEIRAVVDSPVDTRRKAMMKAAYDANTEAEVDKARKQKKAAFAGVVDPMADVNAAHDSGHVPDVIVKQGTQLDTPVSINRQLAPLSYVEAARQIRGLVGDLWTPANYQQLTQLYPDTDGTGKPVPADAIDSIVQRIKGGRPVQHLKAVNE